MSLALVAKYLQMEVCEANIISHSHHQLLLGFDFWLKRSGPVNPRDLSELEITENQNLNLHVSGSYSGSISLSLCTCKYSLLRLFRKENFSLFPEK